MVEIVGKLPEFILAGVEFMCIRPECVKEDFGLWGALARQFKSEEEMLEHVKENHI